MGNQKVFVNPKYHDVIYHVTHVAVILGEICHKVITRIKNVHMLYSHTIISQGYIFEICYLCYPREREIHINQFFGNPINRPHNVRNVVCRPYVMKIPKRKIILHDWIVSKTIYYYVLQKQKRIKWSRKKI